MLQLPFPLTVPGSSYSAVQRSHSKTGAAWQGSLLLKPGWCCAAVDNGSTQERGCYRCRKGVGGGRFNSGATVTFISTTEKGTKQHKPAHCASHAKNVQHLLPIEQQASALEPISLSIRPKHRDFFLPAAYSQRWNFSAFLKSPQRYMLDSLNGIANLWRFSNSILYSYISSVPAGPH